MSVSKVILETKVAVRDREELAVGPNRLRDSGGALVKSPMTSLCRINTLAEWHFGACKYFYTKLSTNLQSCVQSSRWE